MIRFLVLSCLYFVSLLSYAQTCPYPPSGFLFRVAAWGNHSSSTSQIRCHYYDETGRFSQEIDTVEFFNEAHMDGLSRWNSSGDRYYLCTSFNTNVNECAF